MTASGTGKPTWDRTGFQQGPKSGNVSGGRSAGILFTRFRHSSTKQKKIVLSSVPDPKHFDVDPYPDPDPRIHASG
jgi:hypothetical protein